MAASIVPIEEGTERLIEVQSSGEAGSPNIQLWLRLWGNRASGIPVLFVHGGPGNSVLGTYGNVNKEFFDCNRFFVVEVDQRGTGKSQPSVTDPVNGVANMELYRDISLPQMSNDFEVIRKELGIDKWLVFGGSWGSTLSLDYALRFPERCLGLIVRAIFLGTRDEHDAVYARKSFVGDDSELKKFQLRQFDIFFDYAKKAVERLEPEAPLDPDDSERICRVYQALVMQGDRKAAWMCYAYEENLMVETESDLISYEEIDEAQLVEAWSTAFFEMRLFVRLAFEEPAEFVSRLEALAPVKTWVVQGTGDAVCPDFFARKLVAGLERANIKHEARFVDASHKCTSNNIKLALQQSVKEFIEGCS